MVKEKSVDDVLLFCTSHLIQRPFGIEKMLNPVRNCLSTLLSIMYCISKQN
jgi:hypothetical protein